MSEPAFPPSASTTLVILLGASAWPNSPGFQASRAFLHAAQGFRNYLLDPRGFGVATANLLDQFDAQTSSSDQLELLGSFLEERTQALKTAKQAVRDVLVYFVGHGGFAGPSADFYLLLRRTNASSLRASGMAIDALAEVLREKARQMRRYLFLDCCFAAAAFRAFQGGPDQTAITKTLDAFAVQARSSGFPRRGTVLLCSSDQKSPSLLLPDESCTMFSYALLDVLKNGDIHRQRQLSLRDIKELAEDRLATLPEKNAPRPGLHSPDQSEGDVADVPFFRNPRAEQERRRQSEETERVRLVAEGRVQNIAEQASPMPSQTFPPTTSPYAAVPPQGLAPHSPIAPTPAAIPPQGSATLPPPSTSVQPKRQRSPAVIVTLILLTLILLGGGSFGIYGAATGNWPWSQNISRRQSTPVSSNTSVPGMMWHAQNSGTSNSLNAVAWSGSQFVVMGEAGIILTSPDGRTWTAQHSGTSKVFNGVVWTGSQFVAVGFGGTILTSPDGRTWTAQHSGTTQILKGVAWSGSQFVVVGVSDRVSHINNGIILTSPDGRTWTAQNAGTSQDLLGVVWADSQFVAVGWDGSVVGGAGIILTSPDGHTWTAQHSGTSNDLRGVAWSGSLFVAVGLENLLTSPNGRTWTASPTKQVLNAVTWSGSLFVVVGCPCNGGPNNSLILTSPDGHTWTAQNSPTTQDLWGVAWSGSQFVVVGDYGTILSSP